MITKQTKIPKSGWAILSVSLGAALANACGDPFSSCEAHRSCPTTGGAGGESGAGDANETGGQGGEAHGASGSAGDGASGRAMGGATGGESNAGGAGTGGDGSGGVTAGGTESGGSSAGGTSGGTPSTEGGSAGAENGGETSAGAGGSAGTDAEGGSGGAAPNPCDPNPCTHGGTCVAKASTSTCKCTKGYTGALCELPVFEGIGVLDGQSFAYSLSSDGKTVSGDNGHAAILWTSRTGIYALDGLAGSSFCRASALSADGAILIGVCLVEGNSIQLVRWRGGKIETLDAQSFGDAWASAVNSDGSVVVGYIRSTSTTSRRAFRWTASSGLVEIPALSPGKDTLAFATNAEGSTVVGKSGTLGFRWSIGSNPQSLGTRECFPLGINADGSVVVGDVFDDSGKRRAFRWTQIDGLVDLGVLSSDPETHAYDVSADGSVIVGESGPEEEGEGLLWTESAGLQPLKTVLANAGADLTGWQVGTATAVSADGKVIVGYGTHDGHKEGWIARLP